MLFTRTLILILAAISFIIVIGGAVYEHAGAVPIWASAVPASLAMFQGEYAITPFRFWMPVHPVTVILLLVALALNWSTERRKYILMTLVGYFIVLIATFTYFVPELMSIVQTAYSTEIDPDLTQKAKTWETMSLLRLAFMLVLAVLLLFGVSKSGEPRRRYRAY